MSHSNDEKQMLSRREALKTLAAATGAIALANLPEQWATPVVEAGVLPAHAQGSPTGQIIISNLAVTFTGVNNCTVAGLGLTGSSNEVSFSYEDQTGNVTSSSVILLAANLPTDLNEIPFTSSSVNVTVQGNEFNGSINISNLCARFGSTNEELTIFIRLRNAAGQESNTIEVTVAKPVGAQDGDGVGSLSSQ